MGTGFLNFSGPKTTKLLMFISTEVDFKEIVYWFGPSFLKDTNALAGFE
jgi:hypothetical protein